MSSSQILIKSRPEHVFRGLLAPGELVQWWGCNAVIDAKQGGVWMGGWGEGPDGYGQGTVLAAELAVFEKNRRLAIKIGETVIDFRMDFSEQGTTLTITQQGFPSEDPAEEQAALQSWVDAAMNLKEFVEHKNPYTPPRPKPAPQPSPIPQSVVSQPSSSATSSVSTGSPLGSGVAGLDSGKGGAVDPYGGLEAMEGGDYRIIDDGGFGVTDPHAVIKSWSKEQGFGYVTHKELGDIVFDYDGCDFEPSIGDKVILLVLGKRFDGKPKVKRIACPEKGSKLNK